MTENESLFYGTLLILYAIYIRFSANYCRGVDLYRICFPVFIFLGVCFVAYYVAARTGLILTG